MKLNEKSCVGCGKTRSLTPGLPLCPNCVIALRSAGLSTKMRCPKCLSIVMPGKPCKVCARDRTDAIKAAFSPFRYIGTVRSILLRLKFHSDLRGAALLAPFMRKALGAYRPDCLIPVPLSVQRIKERGFNQADVLCSLVARDLNVPVLHALSRNRDTRRQTDLKTVQERQSNVIGAFDAEDFANLSGMRVLLVDDVRTTGSTAIACAEALKKRGAAEICLLTAAVAPGSGKNMKLKRSSK